MEYRDLRGFKLRVRILVELWLTLPVRFIQGIGLGAELPVAATYMNEFTRAELRGRLVVLFQAIFAFGVMVTAFAAIWVVPHLGWQWMFVIGALPAILAVWLRRLVPELPRWLAAHGKLDEADKALSRIENEVVAQGGTPAPVAANIPKIVKENARWSDLFGRNYLPAHANRMGSGVRYVARRLLPAGMASDDLSHSLSPAHRTKPAVQFYQLLCGPVWSLSGALLIDRFGRRVCFIVSFLGACIPLLTLWWLSRETHVDVITVVELASVALFFISILLAAIYVYLPEIYPTRMRALGSGAANALMA